MMVSCRRAFVLYHCFFLWSLGWSSAQQDETHLKSVTDLYNEASSHLASDNWSYSCSESSEGPDHWADLDPRWAVCKSGRMQSPIDVHKYELEEDLELGMLPLTYDNAPEYSNATITNDGRTIKVIRGGGSLIIKGVNYSLAYVDFHSPSEHTINGVEFPLEMQVFHVSPEGANAIIVAVFEYGEAENPVLEQVTSQLGKLKKNQALAGVPVNIYSKPTDTHHYYQYGGSLTTPPCTEGVIWTIVSTIYKVSPIQLALFRVALEGSNSRPVQALNERKVSVSAF
ncbi:hypothetical protein O6H91_04G124400 [Diphasiastrum complanatum]|uniref:Uncharacterized protein n=2 Tax=Diphasiastrum complanatum TaxID=34168 RepID=A0ACC2E1D8_DIPCM|nr:hypothetical protein O6H91_04G124400 [Diphasiastrum complanatum]